MIPVLEEIYFTIHPLFNMHFLGYRTLRRLEGVNIEAEATIQREAREEKGEKLRLYLTTGEVGKPTYQNSRIKKKKSEKQIHHQTLSLAPFISTSVVLIERLTAGSWKINVFSLTRECLNDSQMQK